MSSSSTSSSAEEEIVWSSDNTYIQAVDKKTASHYTYNVGYYNDIIRTTVTRTDSIVNRWIKEVYTDFEEGLIVGLDIEWVRLQETSQRNKVAVLQLCVDKRCLIFQFLFGGANATAPASLKKFLNDERILFVGVGIDKKARRLLVDHELNIARSEDLGGLADYKLGREDLYELGLKKLAWNVLRHDLPKRKHQTLSRWDASTRLHNGTLKDEQVEYACLDAYVSLQLGVYLMGRPDPSNKGFSYSLKDDLKKLPHETKQGAKATNKGQGAREAIQGPKAPYKNRAPYPAVTASETSKDSEKKYATPREDSKRRGVDENSIRVSNLPYDTPDDALRALFASYGTVLRARFILDRSTGKSRGLCFVNFVHKEDGVRAIKELDGCEYDGRILTVEWADTDSETSKDSDNKWKKYGPPGSDRKPRDQNSIRVSNLSDDTNDDDLLALFDGFGPVKRACVMLDEHTIKSRGFGFVNFVHKEDAQRAIEEMDRYRHDYLVLRVQWAAAPRSK
ncbi:hypothetical protein MKW94_008517 [Papaver nudicaule]|uniref:RRM domain-containing protein n=1 Tax=Papaver nudicaule TaxID=74823 RepID=A0AA41VHK6_PAPNU|nr:hypothetical protein [Papaver nudicaule]